MQSRIMLGLAAISICGAGIRAQSETFARYSFAHHDLTSSHGNSYVNASDLHVPGQAHFQSGKLCIEQGIYEFTVTPTSGYLISLSDLDIEFGGGSGGVDRLTVTADEDPGSGGDNFQTVLYYTTYLHDDVEVSLGHVPFLRGQAGPINIRLEYGSSGGHHGSHHDPIKVEEIELDGYRFQAPQNNEPDEECARYSFSRHDLTSSHMNPNAVASDLRVPGGSAHFRSGKLCVVEGDYEFTVESADGGPISLDDLDIDFGGGYGGVDGLTVTADEDPGSGGDNFHTVLFSTSHVRQDLKIDLRHVAFLQNAVGPITIRLSYTDSSGHYGQHHDQLKLDKIELECKGVRNPNNPQAEDFACFEFEQHNLTSSNINPNVIASNLHVPGGVAQFERGKLCIVDGNYEFTVEPLNPGDTLSLTDLLIDYGSGYGGVDRLIVTADEDPGPGGDNFQSILGFTTAIFRNVQIDLGQFAFLQNASGPITIRLSYEDRSGIGQHHPSPLKVDEIKLKGQRQMGPQPPNGNNPCIGPQLFFDGKWSSGNYMSVGLEDAWSFPRESVNFDTARVGNADPRRSNHLPSIWATECSVGCRRMEFIAEAEDDGRDDDSIGFVLGFRPGDATNPDADYLAVIWNGASETAQLPNHCETVTKTEGLTLVRVTGIPDAAEFFGQTNLPCTPASSGVEVLARAQNLGNTGWVAERENDIRVEITQMTLQIWVNGVLELDLASDYRPYLSGGFGYYAQSQFAEFWGLRTAPLNPVQAFWENYGAGTAGCNGVPEVTMTSPPVLNSNPEILVANPGTADVPLCAVLGCSSGSLVRPAAGRQPAGCSALRLGRLHRRPAGRLPVRLQHARRLLCERRRVLPPSCLPRQLQPVGFRAVAWLAPRARRSRVKLL